jgi:hypothetical protein
VVYDDITEEDLKDSMYSKVGELKATIIETYSQSMPALSKKEIIDAGVAITHLCL